MVPVSRPRPSGLYATSAMPSSWHAWKIPTFSVSSVKAAYSNCAAEIGWTACARRSVSNEHSEMPRYLTLPALER